MAQREMVLYNGRNIKAVPAWDLDNDDGWTPIGGPTQRTGADLFFARVPWLYRGVIDRANNVAAMPFAIMQGGTDVITSQDWDRTDPDVGFFGSPKRLFHLLEQSLAMTKRAYVFIETNKFGYPKKLTYCKPQSIEEVFDKESGELTGYRRTYGKLGRKKDVAPKNLIAIYGPDYMTEAGAPDTSDAKAALTAAGVLFNADRFIANYFGCGAIKASILTVDGGRDEAERLQNWWTDVVTGIKNAWSSIVIRAKQALPVVVGEGLEGLQNNELTTERRQDIATALGVPESHLWSAAANYATKSEDEKQYIKGTITPECELIAEAFNEQLFNAEHNLDGYALEFRPETLEIFQQDASEQAQAANTFADLFSKFPTFDIWEQSLILHGYELPEKLVTAAKKYYADKEAQAEEMRQNALSQPVQSGQDQSSQTGQNEPTGEQPPEASPREVRAVLNQWKRKSELWLKKSGSALCPFETTIVSPALQGAIVGQLEEAKTAKDIQLIFSSAWRGYP